MRSKPRFMLRANFSVRVPFRLVIGLSLRIKLGPGAVAQWLRCPFYPGCPASLPAPCLWPGKAVENGLKLWDPAPMWETRKRLLASDRHSIDPLRSLGE